MKKLLLIVIIAASLTHTSNAEDGSNWIDPKEFIETVNSIQHWELVGNTLDQFKDKTLGYPTAPTQQFIIPLPNLVDLTNSNFKFNGSLQNIKDHDAYLQVNPDVQVYFKNQLDTIPFNDQNIQHSNCQNCYKYMVTCKAKKPEVQCKMEPQGLPYTTGCSYTWVCSIK